MEGVVVKVWVLEATVWVVEAEMEGTEGAAVRVMLFHVAEAVVVRVREPVLAPEAVRDTVSVTEPLLDKLFVIEGVSLLEGV
jgi:hypothetical protein